MARIGIEYNKDINPKTSVVIRGFLFLFFFWGVLVEPYALSEVDEGEILLDRLVAEINGEPLTYIEVMEKIKNGPLVEVDSYPATETDTPFLIALNDLINMKLIMQKAHELDIDAKDENVEIEIERFLSNRKLNKQELLGMLQNQGKTYEEYKENFKNQMILNQFQGRVILPAVKISDKDIEIYYLKKTENTVSNVKLILREIYVKIPSNAMESIKAGKKELIEKVYNDLKNGLSFKEAVKIYSESERVKNEGIMPPIYLKDLSKVFQGAIERLEEGEFTTPIQVSGGFYIFYLEKKSFAGSEEFERQKKELEFSLRREEVTKQTVQWLKDQRRRSKIKILMSSEK
ncbi:MAG: SurA N-terminal domain-containing protein [Oligoflexales bacterium]|nr:SurA N-terminal domain-containing protein [Oligoflexales bacterium]